MEIHLNFAQQDEAASLMSVAKVPSRPDGSEENMASGAIPGEPSLLAISSPNGLIAANSLVKQPRTPQSHLRKISLPAVLALAMLFGCDCEQLLARQRDSRPVYRVDDAGGQRAGVGERDSALARQVESARTATWASAPPRPSQPVAPSQIADAAKEQGESPDTSSENQEQRSGASHRPPVWSKSVPGAAGIETAEPHVNERPQEDESGRSHHWGSSTTSLSRLGRIHEVKLPPLGSRVVLKGIEGRSDLVEAAMPDKPPMDQVPDNP